MRRRVGLGVGLAVLALALWALLRSNTGAPGAATGDTPNPPPSAASAPLSRAKTSPLSVGIEPVADAGTAQVYRWGNGAGELGRARPGEGNPEAPMSLTIDGHGTTWVLDQVNQRLVKIDRQGRWAGTVPLPVQAAQDVVVAPDGTALVMDRLVDRAVAVMSGDGALKGSLPLAGKGLLETGASTGVFVDGDAVVVEREHGDSVRIGSLKGVPDADRAEVPGRPTRDGQAYLTASLVDRQAGSVLLTVIDRPSRQHRFTRQYGLKQALHSLVLLDADRHGVIYLGAGSDTGVTVLCLAALDGQPLGQVRLPLSSSADETFRELAVSDDGEVVALVRTEEGAQLHRATCR